MSFVKKQQKKQLYKEGQAAAKSIKKYYAPKVTQLGPVKPAEYTLTTEVRKRNEQPSTNSLKTKKIKKTAKRKKK